MGPMRRATAVNRAVWLFLTVLLSLTALVFWHVQLVQAVRTAATPPLIINEWSQGSAGSQEWVELLVVAGPLDLRGWALGDSTPGDLVFADDPLWAQVAAGTRIVIYNGSDVDSLLPPPDSDASDCTLVLPHSSPGHFAGGWPAFANSNTADNPQVTDASATAVHDYSQQPGSPHPGASQRVAFQGDSSGAVAAPASWELGSAADATPGAGNSAVNAAWIDALCQGAPPPDQADLRLSKSAPGSVRPGEALVYELRLANLGTQPAAGVWLTDTLPAGLAFVAQASDLIFSQPQPGVLVWQAGTLAPGAERIVTLTTAVAATATGALTNTATAVTTSDEPSTANNTAETVTHIVSAAAVVIDAVLPDGYEAADADEAVALRNVSATAVDLGGWQIGDGGTTRATLPDGVVLPPGASVWVTRDAAAFERQFGHAPDVVVGSWPGFANAGDEVQLLAADGTAVDTLVYGGGSTTAIGWSGPAVEPYVVRGVLSSEGQVLYRMRDQATGQPVADSDAAADWAQSTADVLNGRKVRYPGWDLDDFFFTRRITEAAVVTVAIAPDNAYETLVAHVNAAQTSLHAAALTFENIALAEAFAAAARRGVDVKLLLEGAPAGGLPDAEKYVCQLIETAGGACWFMISAAADDIFDRYRFMHAKYVLIDGREVAISSENLSPNSMPDDDKLDGTLGRRGVVIVTDAPGVVAHVRSIFERDLDPVRHVDLRRWQASDPDYGVPPVGFTPIRETGGVSYTVRYPTAAVFTGRFAFELVQSPENSLRDVDGLLGMVNRAGVGDRVLVQQLQERPFWGATSSNAQLDPNPRLEAYIAAARRGARVQLQLDAYFDSATSPTANAATCAYVHAIAQAERLQLACSLGNPTGLGIHNKMVLVEADGRGYVHIGSLNGTEQASKGNRELALQIESDAVFALLADVFYRDHVYVQHLPVVLNKVEGAARHVLISEVLYDSFGPDDAEFIELVNPTNRPVDLSGYGVGDAVSPTDFEDVRRFPPGTVLGANETLVVATTAVAFFADYGRQPDFEVLETDAAVANLIDDPRWGDTAAHLQLGNAGDEVILRDPSDQIVDAIAYGAGALPGLVPCPLVAASEHSLERYPYWLDSENCAADFRDWPFPSPGRLPE